MFRLQVTIIRQTFQYMDITEYIEYIVVFWLNDILFNTSITTQRDGAYKKRGRNSPNLLL